MAKDVSDVIGTALGNAAREAIQGVQSKSSSKKSNVPGAKGLAAGAAGVGLMALAPLAQKGLSKLTDVDPSEGVDKLKEASVGKLKDASVGKVKHAGEDALKDVGGKVKDDVADSIPGGGLLKGKSGGVDGVGKGRRMPVQQSADIGVPVTTVYNQFTQFEEWPKFMHRVQSVSQEDESHLNFKVKMWTRTREYTAEITEQRPDERIAWKVTEGISHTGVVTFHELAPRLTRVDVSLDLQPGGMIEKMARGMRFVKRAVRADLARFKAYILVQEEASGEWRGEIEDGEVKKRSSRRSQGSPSGQSRSQNSGESSSSGRSRSASGQRRTAAAGRSSGSRSRSSSNGSGDGSSGDARGRSSSGSRSRSRSSSSGRGSGNGSSSGSSASRSGSGSSRSSRATSGSRS
jgi:uncharacterized membrane protein